MHKPAEHIRRVVGRAIARADARDLQVLLVFLGDNVHGVVEGHDAKDVTVLVANGMATRSYLVISSVTSSWSSSGDT